MEPNGNDFKNLREACYLTRMDLSRRSGFGYNTLCKIESGADPTGQRNRAHRQKVWEWLIGYAKEKGYKLPAGLGE